MPALTDLTIRKLSNPATGSAKHLDPSLPGFGIRCTARSKSFFVMYGSERRVKTLGRWPDLSLRDARKAAMALLVSPPQVKRTMKVGEARDLFLADCRKRLRPSTTDRYHYALKDLPDTKLEAVSTDCTDPTELKVRKAFFNWCFDRQYIDHNPFARRKVKFGERDRLLTDEELKAIWNFERPPYSDIVKLLILTGQRRNQILRFKPDWREGAELTFPATIMKSNRAHRLPVTGYGAYLPDEPFSFNGWSKSKARLDKVTGVTDWVLHDLRRYFSSTMARLGIPQHVTEQIIDHRTQVSGVAAIYNRYDYFDEMRAALRNYETHIRDVVV